jgi:hypothetical protein
MESLGGVDAEALSGLVPESLVFSEPEILFALASRACWSSSGLTCYGWRLTLTRLLD